MISCMNQSACGWVSDQCDRSCKCKVSMSHALDAPQRLTLLFVMVDHHSPCQQRRSDGRTDRCGTPPAPGCRRLPAWPTAHARALPPRTTSGAPRWRPGPAGPTAGGAGRGAHVSVVRGVRPPCCCVEAPLLVPMVVCIALHGALYLRVEARQWSPAHPEVGWQGGAKALAQVLWGR